MIIYLKKKSFFFTSCTPDATHPDDDTAVDVLLALRLLGVGDTNVLPLAFFEQFFTRFRLSQKPRFYFIIWVDTNPEANRKKDQTAV